MLRNAAGETVRSLVRGLRFYEEKYSSLNKALVLVSAHVLCIICSGQGLFFFFLINGKVQISTNLQEYVNDSPLPPAPT